LVKVPFIQTEPYVNCFAKPLGVSSVIAMSNGKNHKSFTDWMRYLYTWKDKIHLQWRI